MSDPVDHKVRARSERQLADSAASLRRWLVVDHLSIFNPLAAIEKLKFSHLPHKGTLSVIPFRASKGVAPARVKYDPLRLFVDQEHLDEAKIGEPGACFVLNHELGHIIEHDKSAKAFSNEDAKRLSAWPKEERAEWQADTFADFVSLPLKFVRAFNLDRLRLSIECNVPMRVVDRQIARLQSRRNYVGEACSNCGNLTIVRTGTDFKCDTCGACFCR